MTKISFVIVNYNLSDEIRECVESLVKNIKKIKFEIIIVDNNSPEDSAKKLPLYFPPDKFNNIFFYFLQENKGFGSGCNYGAKQVSSDIICFLNPDTVITEDIFDELVTFLNSGKNIAAVSPASTRTRFFDYSAGVFPSFFLEALNVVFLGRLLEAFFINFKHTVLKKNVFPVDWILGASIIIKKDVFSSLKGFDEDYFMFFEEMDLFYRIKKSGYQVFYFPAKKIHHIGSAGTKKDYTAFTRTFYNSKILFFRKQYGPFWGTVFAGITIFQIIVQIIFWSIFIFIFKNKSKSKIKGFLQVLKSFTNNRNIY